VYETPYHCTARRVLSPDNSLLLGICIVPPHHASISLSFDSYRHGRTTAPAGDSSVHVVQHDTPSICHLCGVFRDNVLPSLSRTCSCSEALWRTTFGDVQIAPVHPQPPRHTIFDDLLADVTFDTACFTARPCPKDPDPLALHLRSQPSWGLLLHYYRPEPCLFAFQVWGSGSRAFRRGQWDAAEALSIQESLGLTVNGRRHSAMHPTLH
jgi:hypothetical protein